MDEFRYSYNKAIPPGRVLLRFVNAGRVPHRPTLLPLAEHLPPINVQLTGPVRQLIPPFAGVTTRNPRTSGTIAVDLVPGHRYAFICTAPAPEGGSHAAKGMNSEFRTSGDRK